MIDLYAWPTPNGRKAFLMLEETGLPYTLHPVDIRAGDQFDPEFLRINPNNKIPAIVDHDGPGGRPLALFESGAILIYLAEKTGQFLPTEPGARYVTLQWLMFQMSGIGPMFGQLSHFRAYTKKKIAYCIDRYTKEATRLLRIIDRRLSDTPYLAGAEYTIADIATFPWLINNAKRGLTLHAYPHVSRWYDAVGARPAVQRGLNVLAEKRVQLERTPTDAERDVMFGHAQYQVR